MSNQSDYDRQVKDILDRVAKGHLSSDEAATLIAAASTTPKPSAPTGPAQPGGSSQPAPPSQPTADERPSTSVWADVVDSPDLTGAAKPADPAGPAQPAGPAGPAGQESADTSAVDAGAVAQDSVVDDAPLEGVLEDEPTAVETEAEHSNVPVPAGVQRVTIRAIGRRVRLIGEPAINGVAVDGPHVIKRDGDTLAINSEGDMGVSIDGFSMLRNRSVGDIKSHVNGFAKELSIRVNPMLQVEIEVTGGSVVAERLPGLTRVRVTAGTAKVTDVDGPIDLLVQAGSATLDAQITKGRSRVRVESGAATVNLRRGSDVRVHTESQLGRVSWTGAVTGQSKDVEIGRGRAALDVEVLVGTAQIVSD
jgi:hypothetical protein